TGEVEVVVGVEVGDDHRVQVGGVDHVLQRAEGARAEVHQHPPEPTVGVLVLEEVARGGARRAGEAAAAADDDDPHPVTTGRVLVLSKVGPRERRERRAKFSLPAATAVCAKAWCGGRSVSRSCSVACSWAYTS